MVFIHFLFITNTSPFILPSPCPSVCNKKKTKNKGKQQSSPSWHRGMKSHTGHGVTIQYDRSGRSPEGLRLSTRRSGILLSFVIPPCLAEQGLPEFYYSQQGGLRWGRRSGLRGSAKSIFLLPSESPSWLDSTWGWAVLVPRTGPLVHSTLTSQWLAKPDILPAPWPVLKRKWREEGITPVWSPCAQLTEQGKNFKGVRVEVRWCTEEAQEARGTESRANCWAVTVETEAEL